MLDDGRERERKRKGGWDSLQSESEKEKRMKERERGWGSDVMRQGNNVFLALSKPHQHKLNK